MCRVLVRLEVVLNLSLKHVKDGSRIEDIGVSSAIARECTANGLMQNQDEVDSMVSTVQVLFVLYRMMPEELEDFEKRLRKL